MLSEQQKVEVIAQWANDRIDIPWVGETVEQAVFATGLQQLLNALFPSDAVRGKLLDVMVNLVGGDEAAQQAAAGALTALTYKP